MKAKNSVNFLQIKPQLVNCYGGPKVVIFIGKCVVCQRNTYGFEGDTNPDPRGVIGVYNTAHDLEASDFDMVGEDVHCCYDCRQTGTKYLKAVEIAKPQWRKQDSMKGFRVWSQDPYKVFFVSELPGDGGVDWGYTEDSRKAILLTPQQQKKFAAYCQEVNSEAKFI